MPDFSKYSNYSEKTSFSSVVVGAQAPVLEVELNEMQEIFDTKFKRLSKFCGNVVIPDHDGGVAFDSEMQELTVTKCTAIAGALTAFIPFASIPLTEVEPVAYLRLEERVVTGNDLLHEYGLVNFGDDVENPIIDKRVGVETSRRKVVEVTLMSGTALPETTNPDACQYILLGSIERTPSEDPDAPEEYSFNKSPSSGSVEEVLAEMSAEMDKMVNDRIKEALTGFVPETHYKDGVLYFGPVTTPV